MSILYPRQRLPGLLLVNDPVVVETINDEPGGVGGTTLNENGADALTLF
jgi:hypothetical protein